MVETDPVSDPEHVPDSDFLFMAVHRNLMKPSDFQRLPKDYVPTQIFRAHGEAMSTDWNKYATPEEVQQRRAEPQLNGVIQINVGSIRKIPPLSVKHAPLAENRAHTNVHGLSNEPGKNKRSELN